jgi:hypothetical protein
MPATELRLAKRSCRPESGQPRHDPFASNDGARHLAGIEARSAAGPELSKAGRAPRTGR